MSVSTRVGTAVAAGYVLGRFKKLRLALVVGSAMANKEVRVAGLNLLNQGTQRLTTSPEIRRLSTLASEQLLDAGRTAVVAAAASSIDRVSDRLRARTDLLRERSGHLTEELEDVYPDEEYPEEEPSKRSRREEPADEYDEEDEEYEAPRDEEDEDEEPEAKREQEPEEEPDEDLAAEEEAEEEDAGPAREEPKPRRRTTRTTTTRRRATAPSRVRSVRS